LFVKAICTILAVLKTKVVLTFHHTFTATTIATTAITTTITTTTRKGCTSLYGQLGF